MRFASFLSGGFTTGAVINPPERKLAKRTSVHRLLECLTNYNAALSSCVFTLVEHAES